MKVTGGIVQTRERTTDDAGGETTATTKGVQQKRGSKELACMQRNDYNDGPWNLCCVRSENV